MYGLADGILMHGKRLLAAETRFFSTRIINNKAPSSIQKGEGSERENIWASSISPLWWKGRSERNRKVGLCPASG